MKKVEFTNSVYTDEAAPEQPELDLQCLSFSF